SSDWGLSFTYDGFGNKTHQSVTKGSGPVHSYSIDVATNRITNPGFQYDANGNVTAGLLGLTGTYTYDVENRMVDNGAEKYGYGAGNRRLWKMLAGQGPVADVYFYGLGGEVLEVFRGSPGSPLERQTYAPTQRAWFGGRLIEKKGTAMNADRLGTYEKSFPYGELATAPVTSGEKFATYWRDAGTGLDYAVNRYYSPQMGRFLTADPIEPGEVASPGSWNYYAYVEGDPANYNDPEGTDVRPLNITYGTTPTCLETFTRMISIDPNGWFNSDVGTLALHAYFEWRGDNSRPDYDANIWNGIANVWRNRWHLTDGQKRLYLSNYFADLTKQYGFRGMFAAYASSENFWVIQNKRVFLRESYVTNSDPRTPGVIQILNSSPDSGLCQGFIHAMQVARDVYNVPWYDHSQDPTHGALFYASQGRVPGLRYPLEVTYDATSATKGFGTATFQFFRPRSWKNLWSNKW
ncbi:MAG TPA: RHS repeat-associated core domain-containing protein, partial [Paludibaculum sp.]